MFAFPLPQSTNRNDATCGVARIGTAAIHVAIIMSAPTGTARLHEWMRWLKSTWELKIDLAVCGQSTSDAYGPIFLMPN